jgi:Tfp pilus assembly protein PilW
MLIGLLGLLALVSFYLAKRLSDEKTENAALRDRIASLKRQLARRRAPVGT